MCCHVFYICSYSIAISRPVIHFLSKHQELVKSYHIIIHHFQNHDAFNSKKGKKIKNQTRPNKQNTPKKIQESSIRPSFLPLSFFKFCIPPNNHCLSNDMVAFLGST